jgi:choline dehydrogenase-like flavoprotein
MLLTVLPSIPTICHILLVGICKYFSVPHDPYTIIADVTMLREGLKLARKIGQTAPLSKAMGKELFPGAKVNTDAEWNQYLANNVGTEYHPSCTCAMLPESQGGVVDANLRVYGLGKFSVSRITLLVRIC